MASDVAIEQLYDACSLCAEINFADGSRFCVYSDGDHGEHGGSEPEEQRIFVVSRVRTGELLSPTSATLEQQATEARQWLHRQLFSRTEEDFLSAQQRRDAVAGILARIALRIAKKQHDEDQHEEPATTD